MRAFLFDLDGTLIDSREDIAASANAARRAVGLSERPAEEIYPLIGEGAARLIERTLGEEHADKVSAAIAAWRAHYAEHLLDRTRVFPGILEALARLEGARAVVTNKPGPMARALVEGLGLSALCPVVVGPGEGIERKPSPDGIFEALRLLGGDIPLERVVLVGDSGIDAATARAAGIAFVGVEWGLRPREELVAEGARYLAREVAELPRRIEEALDGQGKG